jgi:hypothetical protein
MPIPPGGSVLTLHQSHDTETDGQCITRDWSWGWHSPLLEISYFTAKLQYVIFKNIILSLGKMRNSQDWCPAIQVEKINALVYLTAALTTFLASRSTGKRQLAITRLLVSTVAVFQRKSRLVSVKCESHKEIKRPFFIIGRVNIFF